MYLLFYEAKAYSPSIRILFWLTKLLIPWVGFVLRFDKFNFDFEGTEVAEGIIRDNFGKKILLVTGFAQLSANILVF